MRLTHGELTAAPIYSNAQQRNSRNSHYVFYYWRFLDIDLQMGKQL